MRIVHGLEGDARVIAVEVAILYQVFDSVHDLERCEYADLEGFPNVSYLLEQVCLLQPCLEHCVELSVNAIV